MEFVLAAVTGLVAALLLSWPVQGFVGALEFFGIIVLTGQFALLLYLYVNFVANNHRTPRG